MWQGKPKAPLGRKQGKDKLGRIKFNVLIIEDMATLLSTVGRPRRGLRPLGGVVNPILF